jgi:hypothetical protein
MRALLLCIALNLVTLELAARAAWRFLALDRRTADVEIELPADAPLFAFDPISGYRITPTPVRYAKFDENGAVQSWGVVRGNNLGFPDAKDFLPSRNEGGGRRIAVFGDSMSAGFFLPVPWPQRVESLSRERGRPLEVLNFSIDGGGVMNWWSVLTRLVEPEGYELDGCVFAVCCDDLARGFFIRHEDRGPNGRRLWFGRVRGFRRQDLPDSLESARNHFFWLGDAPGCTPRRMDEFLAGSIRSGARGSGSSLVDFAAVAMLLNHFRPQGTAASSGALPDDLKNRIQEMRDSLRKLNAPALVVQVPMLQPYSSPPAVDGGLAPGTQAFADVLEARAVSGADAFRDAPPERLKAFYLQGDAHWRQEGSDRFADFVEAVIADWLDAPPSE